MTDDVTDPVEEASRESFPASDPPAWTMGSEKERAAVVSNNVAQKRFEASSGGVTGFLTYSLHPDTITFLHTEVPPELRGHRIGDALAHAGLEFARREKREVIPRCPFVAEYVRRHQEYADLMANHGS